MIAGRSMDGAERVETVIIGGGQAGLATGYQLATRGLPFVILDANERIGDSWRKRWDSLRLFTPARYDGLPGWPFPAPAWSFPSKDQVADYLASGVLPARKDGRQSDSRCDPVPQPTPAAVTGDLPFDEFRADPVLAQLRQALPEEVELWAGGAGVARLDSIAGVRLLPTLESGRQALAALKM